MSLPPLSLILGGARSGKSRFAEDLISPSPPPWTYIATAEIFDDEMRQRIAAHRQRRATGWNTREAPLALAEAIAASPPGQPILVDCLTLWLTNVLLSGATVKPAVEGLLAAARAAPGPLVFVSNEVGLGIVPDNALARAFRDYAGHLNQRLAAEAALVVFIAAGLPMVLKGSLETIRR